MKSIAQKTSKRTPAPESEQQLRGSQAKGPALSVVPEPAATPSLGDKVADIRNRHRGRSLADVVTASAEDLSIIIQALETGDTNVGDVFITRMLEVQDILYAVAEELEARANGKAVA